MEVLQRIFIVIAACALGFALYKSTLFFLVQAQRRKRLRPIPTAPDSVPILGHLFSLINHPLPWERMLEWCKVYDSDIVRWYLPFEDWIIVRGGEAMRAVLQTKFRDFDKEVAMSFHPFLCILGSGLVTSHGQLWQTQRKLMTPAFKGDILQEVIDISMRATQRLSAKLDSCQASGSSIEIDEEFRLLTLQVSAHCSFAGMLEMLCLCVANLGAHSNRTVHMVQRTTRRPPRKQFFLRALCRTVR